MHTHPVSTLLEPGFLAHPRERILACLEISGWTCKLTSLLHPILPFLRIASGIHDCQNLHRIPMRNVIHRNRKSDQQRTPHVSQQHWMRFWKIPNLFYATFQLERKPGLEFFAEMTGSASASARKTTQGFTCETTALWLLPKSRTWVLECSIAVPVLHGAILVKAVGLAARARCPTRLGPSLHDLRWAGISGLQA